MIGLSLSFCVKGILEGNVDLSQVDKIIASIKCKTDKDFYEVIAQYKRNYWYKYPEKQIDEVIEQLKPIIYQPRLTEKRYPVIASGKWVDNEDQIEWRNEYD